LPAVSTQKRAPGFSPLQARNGGMAHLVLCPLTRDKEEFVKETDIAPKRHLAFVANLFLQWKAVNQYPH